jgi:hypothetical protein
VQRCAPHSTCPEAPPPTATIQELYLTPPCVHHWWSVTACNHSKLSSSTTRTLLGAQSQSLKLGVPSASVHQGSFQWGHCVQQTGQMLQSQQCHKEEDPTKTKQQVLHVVGSWTALPRGQASSTCNSCCSSARIGSCRARAPSQLLSLSTPAPCPALKRLWSSPLQCPLRQIQ